MSIKLTKNFQEFRNPQISHVDAKTINLDRTLVNFFMLVKYNGCRPIAIRRRGDIKLKQIYERLTVETSLQRGLEAYPEIVTKWLGSDLIDLVFRGGGEKEAVAAPRPLTLDAYKLRNAKHTRDYNSSDQLYSMLASSDPDIFDLLRTIFDSDVDDINDDLGTLIIKRLVSGKDLEDRPGSERVRVHAPLSPVAARTLADDIRRLLAYQKIIPRPVMLEYLKTLVGFHLGLYILRLFTLLPLWVKDKQVNELLDHQPLMLVDMGADFHSMMARLSQANVSAHFARINEYVKAVFTVNQLLSYMNLNLRHTNPATVAEALAFYQNPPDLFQPTFNATLMELWRKLDDQREDAKTQNFKPRTATKIKTQWEGIDAIRDMSLPAFEKLVEIISYIRTPFHRQYHYDLIDSLLQKNSDSGLLRQGRARANARRFHIGSRLLEVLVQLAVLESNGASVYTARPILISDLIGWLHNRYGLVINGLDVPELARQAGVSEIVAYRNNVRALKDRLREIGFYTDLSDAYNAQTIRPRYSMEEP